MKPDLQQELIEYLSQFTTEHKRSLMERVLAQRTRYITVVLEDIYQPHNASAVIRSCECFGVQDVHVIEKRNTFRPNPEVAVGASQWVSIHYYGREDQSDTQTCLQSLKSQGYRIVATTLRQGSIPLQELDLEQKVALCFGTEGSGLSDAVHEAADSFVHIPMYGFTQSFNISVTAALCLFTLANKLRSSPVPWQLTEAEKNELRLAWMTGITAHGDVLVRHFLKQKGKVG